jgi:hypothetical protein
LCHTALHEGNRTTLGGGPVMVMKDNDGHVLAERQVDPFEAGVLVLCLLYGGLGLAWFDRFAGRAVKLYPYIGGRVFLAMLFIGSVTALLGLTRSTVTGLRLERAGLWLLVSLGAGYAVWTPLAVGWSALSVILFFGILLFVPGAVVAWRRGRLIAQVERALTAPPMRPEERPDERG